MNDEFWNKSDAKKLFDCFMEIEKNQYPETRYSELDDRKTVIERFIKEFGVNHVTINNYTNMMQFLSSITIDTFDSKNFMNGNLTINLGSEPEELDANSDKLGIFDFNNWKWSK